MRNDERAATEPALATQSLTGLFIVQWDASSISQKAFFSFSYLFAFSGAEKEREKERKRKNSEEESFLQGSPRLV